MIKFYRALFLNRALFAGLSCSVVLYICAFFFTWFEKIPDIFFSAFLCLTIIDIFLLFRTAKGVFARRLSPQKLSNGDENEIEIYAENRYPFNIHVRIIDEIPVQFQKRDVLFQLNIGSSRHKMITYKLTPVKRGEYEFGNLQVYISSPLNLVSRRYEFIQREVLPVYPSFLQMRKYELLAISNRLSEFGIKKVRRIGHSMEFEQIRNYVPGDDYRSINWKATARTGEYMVNNYVDEKSQNIYSVIDKSRAMKMPFEGLSLLDYAINASLVLSDIAIHKDDKAGLITVSEKIGSIVQADRRPAHLNKIMEVLYREKTRYKEINMEALYTAIRSTVKQRSLIVLFTNFETVQAMRRQIAFLKKISALHLLLVVFFENTELKKLSEHPAKNVEDIYIKTVARKFAFEKKLIVMELNRHGIQALLSSPKDLTVNTINRYLEIKSRHKI